MSGDVHPFGVRTPPDPCDANHEGSKHIPFCDDGVTYCGWTTEAGTFDGCGEMWPCAYIRGDDLAPDASGTPQAPRTAPDSTPRGSVDTEDGSEALRARWLAAIRPLVELVHPIDRERDEYLTALSDLDALVLAYGREQATQALRAAGDAYGHNFGVRRFMRERAEELGRQTP